MSIRKVSDLPGLSNGAKSPKTSEYNDDDFMNSLLEVSYYKKTGTNVPNYSSRYMLIYDFVAAISALVYSAVSAEIEDNHDYVVTRTSPET